MTKMFVSHKTGNTAVSSRIIILILAALVSGRLAGAAPAEVLSVRGNHNIENFGEAKRILHKVFEGHELTLYCGCRYYGKELNLNSCGIMEPGRSKRLKKLEWEHMVPAAKFGEAIAAWQTGDDICQSKGKKKGKGRKCAEKASPLFRQMEGDLYNLWPESGEINGARSNKPPREEVEGQVKKFGSCATQIGKSTFVPRPEVRGTVARAYLYMNWAYEVALSPNEKSMFEKWNREHPPTEFECERSKRIKNLQGNPNPFLETACLKSQ